MPFYETVFIARQDLNETQVKALTDKFSKIITDQKGKIHKVEQWGLRTLAYKINKNRKGHYVLIESDTTGESIIELERNMGLEEDVLRFITVRETELSKGPSVVMDKSREREEREDRSDRFDRGDRPERTERYSKNEEAA